MRVLELILWSVTGLVVVVILWRNLGGVGDGIRWWLRPNLGLLVRLPLFLFAAFYTIISIGLVYNVNAWAWVRVDQSGTVYFRWWLLLIAPLVLSLAGLCFAGPLVCYFRLVPRVFRETQFSRGKRFLLGSAIFVGISGIVYAVGLFFHSLLE